MKKLILLFFLPALCYAQEWTVHAVTEAGITFKAQGKGGTYTKPLPERVEIYKGSETAWDAETMTLTVTTPSEEEEGEPRVEEYTITKTEIESAWAYAPPPPKLPLTERLKAYLDAQPVQVRAAYEPLRRPVWDAIERGDLAVARYLIEQASVPAELEPQRQAMLAEFPEQ